MEEFQLCNKINIQASGCALITWQMAKWHDFFNNIVI